jgi:serine phosphatase RsbU (regulator of sigma subunit)
VRGGGRAYVDAGEGLYPPASRLPEGDRATVDRAIGLLAGRIRCRLGDAHRHLVRMAGDQHRDLADVAAGVIGLLEVPEPGRGRRPSAPPGEAGGGITPQPLPPLPAAPAAHRAEAWPGLVQQILSVVPGAVALLTPVFDDDGRLCDLVFAAASPEATALDGRRGAELVGTALSDYFPRSLVSERWGTYARVLRTGEPALVPPFRYLEGVFSVRAHRLGEGLLLSWIRHDPDAPESDRVASTERLGNLGWGDWDLVSGEVHWSAQLYRIYERDPALGPLPREESEALIVPEDRPLRRAAAEDFQRGERVDVTLRAVIGGRVKHLRTVVDAVRDSTGRPLRIYGIVQDVSSQEDSARRLAEVERQLDEQRRDLAAEHELAAKLQRIVLPLPDAPIELPGLKVALRYLPAGQQSLVGGDWYHAAEQRDGSVLLAVGDVAGHGTPAATAMAQLRHALRALAVITTDPAELLGHLNRLVCELERETPELAATAVIARYDPARRRVTWAQAGHPPPLLSRGGRTAPLARPPGTVLGVVDDAVYRCASLDLAVGNVLLLYTDGLIEHRRRSMDEGLDAVIATVDQAVAASPERPLGELLDRLRRANPDDDTCILAARPATGQTQDLRRYLRSTGGVPPG